MKMPTDDKAIGAVAAPPPADIAARLFAGELRTVVGLEAQDLAVGERVARNHMEKGSHGEALRLYCCLVLCEPSRTSFQIGLASAAFELGEYYIALQAASAAIALAPDDPRPYLISGKCCMMIDQYDEAREDFADAMRFSKGDASFENEIDLQTKRLQFREASPS